MSENSQVAEPSSSDYVAKNRLQTADAAIHGWYRFVLGYPPHLVREYLDTLGAEPDRDWIFDPFCGTATTPVEARLLGFASHSADANPISILAARVKLAWDIDLGSMRSTLEDVIDLAASCLKNHDLAPVPDANYQLSLFGPRWSDSGSNGGKLASTFNPDALLPPISFTLIPTGFISPKPLLRVLALRYAIERLAPDEASGDFMRLALAHTIVKAAGNVGFGPEVYRTPPRADADVLGAFSSTVVRMIEDLQIILDRKDRVFPPTRVFADDARNLESLANCPPIGAVITSPPYPNEKDYTRSTRLESVLLGLIKTKADLRALKSGLLRSNTRNVFVGDDDDTWVKDIPSVAQVADEIEQRRQKLGKTSGFERLYHRVTRLYFGGMYRHFAALLPRLRPGARCAYVVGDQMSYFRVHIRTAHLLADVALKAGYQIEGLALWRTRRSTVTRLDLDENVLIIKKPEQGGSP